jgi:Mce-associated membrane protein
MTTVVEKDEAAQESAPAPSARPAMGRAVQVAAVVAAVAAIVTGVLWLVTSLSGAAQLASDRDAALAAAQQAAINLNTLDYHDPNKGLDLWIQSSTGGVRDEFTNNRDTYAKIVADSKRVTQAKATDAAVSELDERAGIARVLVGIDVEVTPDGQQPVTTRQRLQVEMTRTDAGWKVSKLAPVRTPGSQPADASGAPTGN